MKLLYMLNNYEIKLVNKLQQERNLKTQCNYISRPFNTKFFVILCLILYIFNILNKNDMIIIWLASIISTTCKILFKRKRPYINSNYINNYSNKNHRKSKIDKYSFPSGHTILAIVLCFVLFKKYKIYSYLFQIIPIFVGFSRIYLGVHYPSDVIGGIIISSIFTNFISKYVY